MNLMNSTVTEHSLAYGSSMTDVNRTEQNCARTEPNSAKLVSTPWVSGVPK